MVSNMTNIERVKPQVIDGIEFYVSSDRSIAGCSQSGLARLAGVARATLQRHMSIFAQKVPAHFNVPFELKTLLRQPFTLPIICENGAKILKEEVCVALLEYYAFTSPVKNETALYSYRKFAAMGWHSWVLSVTGHSTTTSQPASKNDIADELAEIKDAIKQLGDIKEETKKSHPGLAALIEGYGQSSPNIPRGLRNPFCFAEWALCCGYDQRDHFLIRRVAEHVKALRGKHSLPKLDGRNVYFYADLPAFESAILTLGSSPRHYPKMLGQQGKENEQRRTIRAF